MVIVYTYRIKIYFEIWYDFSTRIAFQVTNRPGPQLVGANGRDDGPGVSLFLCMHFYYSL